MCDTVLPEAVGVPSPKFHSTVAVFGWVNALNDTATSTIPGFGVAVGPLKNIGSGSGTLKSVASFDSGNTGSSVTADALFKPLPFGS